MDILVIGGTQFVGRALVDEAQKRGHTLTLFHRGKTNPDLFPDVEHIHGDRDSDIAKLGEREWDAVIDTCGYIPRHVKTSAAYLADKVKRYVFISTISVYSNEQAGGPDENSPLIALDDKTVEEVTGETYGGLKVLCEQTAQAAMPGRVLIVRPGLIVGPHDPTNRFTYWVRRAATGGDMLAPDTPDLTVQFIDVRDLAEWTLDMTESAATGIYNATGPDKRLTLGELVDTALDVTQAEADVVWVAEDFLLGEDVRPFMDLPLWVPGDDSLMRTDVQKAINAGLTFRPLANTVRDTLDWVQNHTGALPGQAGLTAERERELLEKYANA